MAKNKICSICGRFGTCQRFKSEGDFLCPKHYNHMYMYGKILERTRFDINEIIEYPEYIELLFETKYGKKVSQISKEDYNKIKEYKWYIQEKNYITKDNKKILNFYVYSHTDMGRVSLHRFLFNLNNPKIKVDHINHDTLDNRRENLRICEHYRNIQNSKKRVDNTTGYKGITFYKNRPSKYHVRLYDNNKKVFSKCYKTLEEAIQARKEAEIKYFGEFRNKLEA